MLDCYCDHWRDYWSQKAPAEFELAQNVAKALIACTRDLATPQGAPWIADRLKDEVLPVMRKYWLIEALTTLLNQGMLRGVKEDRLMKLIEQKAEEIANNRPAPAEFHDSMQEFFSQLDNPNMRIAWESFVIELTDDAMGRIGSGAVRMLELSQLLVDANPPQPTLNYLRRISACFIWGFDPECIILCRSALDSAFREKISDEICEKVFGAAEERDFGLLARIRAAHRTQMISDGTRDTAWRVKYRGDKAVHYDPDATRDVKGTVRDTVEVLKVLFPA